MQFQEKMIHLKEMSGRPQKAYKSNMQAQALLMNTWNKNTLFPLCLNLSAHLESPWTTWRTGSQSSPSTLHPVPFPRNIFLNTLTFSSLNAPAFKSHKNDLSLLLCFSLATVSFSITFRCIFHILETKYVLVGWLGT